MSLDKMLDCERKSITKLERYQIPYRFKKIGIILAAISMTFLLVNKFMENSESIRFILRHGLLIGFLIISISKDKVEDEFIKDLRMKSYVFAFIFGVSYSIFMPYFDFGVDSLLRPEMAELKYSGDFMILWMLLAIQVFIFEYFKRMFK